MGSVGAPAVWVSCLIRRSVGIRNEQTLVSGCFGFQPFDLDGYKPFPIFSSGYGLC